MCSSVRVAAAAIAGFLLGGLTGSAVVSWVLMAAAGAAMLAWSRSRERRSGATSCALPQLPARDRPASVTPTAPGPAPVGARLGAPGADTTADGLVPGEEAR